MSAKLLSSCQIFHLYSLMILLCWVEVAVMQVCMCVCACVRAYMRVCVCVCGTLSWLKEKLVCVVGNAGIFHLCLCIYSEPFTMIASYWKVPQVTEILQPISPVFPTPVFSFCVLGLVLRKYLDIRYLLLVLHLAVTASFHFIIRQNQLKGSQTVCTYILCIYHSVARQPKARMCVPTGQY